MRLVLVFLLAFASANLYAQDTTCGIAWGPVINLSGPPPYAFEPHIATQGDTIHATWLQDPGGFRLPYVRSVDGGLTWEPVREMLPDTTIYDRPVNDPWVIANSAQVYLVFVGPHNQGYTPTYFMHSSDRGTTWSEVDTVSPGRNSQIWLATLSGDTLLVVCPRYGPRIVRSTNGGASWDTSLTVVRQSVELSGGILHSSHPVAINSHFEIVHLRSTNLGDSWQDSTVLSAIDGYGSDLPALGLARTNPPSIFVTWRDSKYGCMGFAGCSIILRRSTDNGASWLPETVLTDQPNGYNKDLTGQQVSSFGNTVAACWMDDVATHINLRYSIDGGERWSALCDVTPGRTALDPSCAVSGSVVHVVWNDRLPTHWTIHYRRGVIISTSIKDPEPAPTSFVLHQNFPNPFNPSTTIQYEIAKRGLVSLKVYDFLGQEIATLVNNEEDAGGHEVKWEPKNRASGMYYYRMSVSGGATHSKTRAMMLLR